MTRRETVLTKLETLSNDEVADALKQLTHHVKARLRFGSRIDRTKSGAHGENNLGMSAIDFYVGESVKRLYDPNGWDWKFEKFTLAEQLMRIANKLISDKAADYIARKDGLPVFAEKDTGDIYDLKEMASANVKGNEEVYAKLIQIANDVSQDDDDLQYFVIRYFEDTSYETIAKEMNADLKKVYALRKKLVRRLMDYKEELTA
jgi:hypothetical protein